MTISTNRWGGDTSAPGEPDARAVSAPVPAPGSVPTRPRARWTRSPNVLDRPTLRGVMVLPADGAAVVLTGTAARVWEALARPAAGDELIQRLAPAPADDIGSALSQLHSIGAVRRH
jgi:hypothetical protein